APTDVLLEWLSSIPTLLPALIGSLSLASPVTGPLVLSHVSSLLSVTVSLRQDAPALSLYDRVAQLVVEAVRDRFHSDTPLPLLSLRAPLASLLDSAVTQGVCLRQTWYGAEDETPVASSPETTPFSPVEAVEGGAPGDPRGMLYVDSMCLYIGLEMEASTALSTQLQGIALLCDIVALPDSTLDPSALAVSLEHVQGKVLSSQTNANIVRASHPLCIYLSTQQRLVPEFFHVLLTEACAQGTMRERVEAILDLISRCVPHLPPEAVQGVLGIIQEKGLVAVPGAGAVLSRLLTHFLSMGCECVQAQAQTQAEGGDPSLCPQCCALHLIADMACDTGCLDSNRDSVVAALTAESHTLGDISLGTGLYRSEQRLVHYLLSRAAAVDSLTPSASPSPSPSPLLSAEGWGSLVNGVIMAYKWLTQMQAIHETRSFCRVVYPSFECTNRVEAPPPWLCRTPLPKICVSLLVERPEGQDQTDATVRLIDIVMWYAQMWLSEVPVPPAYSNGVPVPVASPSPSGVDRVMGYAHDSLLAMQVLGERHPDRALPPHVSQTLSLLGHLNSDVCSKSAVIAQEVFNRLLFLPPSVYRSCSGGVWNMVCRACTMAVQTGQGGNQGVPLDTLDKVISVYYRVFTLCDDHSTACLAAARLVSQYQTGKYPLCDSKSDAAQRAHALFTETAAQLRVSVSDPSAEEAQYASRRLRLLSILALALLNGYPAHIKAQDDETE
ncbi:hypothetical protein KIPB_011534, partial [Kipferlia bialata]